MKKLTLAFVGFFLLTVFYYLSAKSWHIEALDVYVKEQFIIYSEKNEVLSAIPEQVQLKLLPLSFQIKNLRVEVKEHGLKKLNISPIEEVEVVPNIISTLLGRPWISRVRVKGTSVQAHIKIAEKETSSQSLQLAPLSKYLKEDVILSHLHLEKVNLKLNLESPQHNFQVDLSDGRLDATNGLGHLLTEVHLPQVNVINLSSKSGLIGSFHSQLYVTNKNIIISDLALASEGSQIKLAGTYSYDINKKNLLAINTTIGTDIQLGKLESFIQFYSELTGDSLSLPKLNGKMTSTSTVESKKNQFVIDSKVQLRDVKWRKLSAKKIQTDLVYNHSEKTIELRNTQIRTPGLSGKAQFVKVGLKNKKVQLKKIQLNRFQMQSFAKNSLGLNLPVLLEATAELECNGKMDPFSLKCPGTMEAKDLVVERKGNSPLVTYPGVQAQGELSVNEDKLSYAVSLVHKNIEGESHGEVDFEKGFQVFFSSPNFDLKDMDALIGLETTGITNLNGYTFGNSKSAQLRIDLKGQDMSIATFELGQLSTQLAYKTGSLFFDKIQGSYGSSRYTGAFNVNILENRLKGQLQMPFLDIESLQGAFVKKLRSPIKISGSGSAVIDLDTDLKVDELSFDLKARLYDVLAEKQPINTLDLVVRSKRGLWDFAGTKAKVDKTMVGVSGTMHPTNETLALTGTTPDFSISSIQQLNSVSSSFKGTLDAKVNINGSFKNPITKMRLSAKDYSIANNLIKNLDIKAYLKKEEQSIKVSSAKKIQLYLSTTDKSPFYNFEANMDNFEASKLISDLMNLDKANNYKINLTKVVKVKVPKENSHLLSGYASVRKLDIYFNNYLMSNERPINLFFSKGKVNFSPVKIYGSNDYINLTSVPSNNPIDLKLDGLFRLSLLRILTPFLETIEGLAAVKLRINSDYKSTNYIGSAFVEDTYIRTPALPHSIENMDVDILFNQNKIILNSVTGRFAEGQIQGDGYISFLDSKKMKTNIDLEIRGAKLNIPEGFQTQGDIQLNAQGENLPITLKGKYEINGGEITKNLLEAGSSKSQTQSVFFPEELKKKDSSPILLDLDIHLLNPVKVVNSLLEGRLYGNLNIKNTPDAPTLRGAINAERNAQVRFKDVVFRTNAAKVQFLGKSPPQPNIYVLAETRYRNYDIELEVQGNTKDPRFKLNSTPQLEEQEILSLLTLGYTNIASDTNDNPSAQSTLEIGTGLLSNNPLGKEVKNRFGFDIQFSSSFDEETSVAVPRIALTRPINDKASVTVSQQTGAERRLDVRLRYDLRKDLSATLSYEDSNAQDLRQSTLNSGDSDVIGVDMEYRLEFD